MTFQLRPYQQSLKDDVYREWNAGNRNVVGVAPTGAGKTAIMSSIASDQTRPAAAIAHRQELVGQISNAMARSGVVHNLIAPKHVIKFCTMQHVRQYGRSFFDHTAPFAVAGVDTLNRRGDDLRQWCSHVGQWTIDESHHVLQGNKWGRATALFPNAFGLGVTATPCRADRKSLHRDQGGIFDSMVVGPSMRDLINEGFLCDYRVYGPPASIDTANLRISSGGDYNPDDLREASHKSSITGDIVDTYQKITPGKQAIAFVVDVEQAIEVAQAFNAVGIRAEAVSAKTPDAVRAALVEKFSNGQIQVLVNVDLFGEGFDVPAVEVVIMGRPTQSYGLYVQQFGRALRTADDKLFGIIIDHVGNVIRHGLPDAPKKWSLWDDHYGKKKPRDPNAIPVTTCTECFMAFEALTKQCPFCGHIKEPEGRSLPEHVDGDLMEFSPELLAKLRGDIAAIDSDFVAIPEGAAPGIKTAKYRQHGEKQLAQSELRDAIALWAGIEKDVRGRDDPAIYRLFYHQFGIDIMSAQALKKAEAEKLTNLVRGTFT